MILKPTLKSLSSCANRLLLKIIVIANKSEYFVVNFISNNVLFAQK